MAHHVAAPRMPRVGTEATCPSADVVILPPSSTDALTTWRLHRKPFALWRSATGYSHNRGAPWEMVERVVDGRTTRVWKNTPPHFRAFIKTALQQHWDRVWISSPTATPDPAAYYDREHFTFGDIYNKAVDLAAWLRSYGVRQGTRVGLGGANSTGWIVSWVAIHLLGAVPVVLNAYSYSVIEAQIHCLAKTRPMVVLLDAELAEVLGPHKNILRAKRVGRIYCWESIKHHPTLVKKGVKELGKLRPPAGLIRDVETGAALEDLGPDSDAVIFFTSGTTNMPKAVLSTQQAALHNVVSGSLGGARAILRQGGDLSMLVPSPKQSAILVAVPLFHVTGSLAWLCRSLNIGAKCVFMRKWNIENAINLIQSENINVIGGVPAIVTAIYQSPLLPKDTQFDFISYGGAPAAERMSHDLRSRWPNASIAQGYGMTEANGVHCGIAGDDYVNLGSCTGPPLPISEVRITHPKTRKVLPPHTMGIIELRGSNVMKCYVGEPAATAATLDKDGWLNSGDMGMLDDEGWLYIQDRAKDIIIRGGENIASAEVENAIALDDRIAEVAAVSVPCPVMGERVGVAVSLAPGAQATEKEIMEVAAPRLRPPARPVIVLVSREPLPRNASGKILKTDVKALVHEMWKRENRTAQYVRAKL